MRGITPFNDNRNEERCFGPLNKKTQIAQFLRCIHHGEQPAEFDLAAGAA
jgi:hypothetical protein